MLARLFFMILVFLPVMSVSYVHGDELAEAANGLTEKSFSKKIDAVEQLSTIKDERAVSLLKSVLAGDIYYRRADKRLVTAQRAGRGYEITDALTMEHLGEVGKRAVKKLSVNNRLRGVIRGAVARTQLNSEDPALRLSAARELMAAQDPSVLQEMTAALEVESVPKIREMLQTGIALIGLEDEVTEKRLAAVNQLSGVLWPEARNGLQQLLEKETDPAVIAAAERELGIIDDLRNLNEIAENLFFGISLGSVLLLAAVGLAITFGVMGVINMAHGEMIMLGAYTTFVIQQWLPNHVGASLLIAIPAAFLVSGLMGVIIERGVIRHLYGRPLETLLATFGISLILQQLVRTVFSPLNQTVVSPDWMSGSVEINGVLSLTYNRIYIILFSLIVLAVLLVVLKKTAFGLQMRAVTLNRPMASSMGIRTDWVDAMTFGLGSGVAGIAGVALSQLTNVGPNLGQAYIIDSFMVVVFGGVGNLMGTFFGAMLLGIANKLAEPFAGAVLAKILVLVFIILFIQKRPRGLFALRGRSVEE